VTQRGPHSHLWTCVDLTREFPGSHYYSWRHLIDADLIDAIVTPGSRTYTDPDVARAWVETNGLPVPKHPLVQKARQQLADRPEVTPARPIRKTRVKSDRHRCVCGVEHPPEPETRVIRVFLNSHTVGTAPPETVLAVTAALVQLGYPSPTSAEMGELGQHLWSYTRGREYARKPHKQRYGAQN
jgi:hypothetical protein